MMRYFKIAALTLALFGAASLAAAGYQVRDGNGNLITIKAGELF